MLNEEELESEYWPRLIRETQRHSGMTLQQVADRLGVTKRAVVYWKAGERKPIGFVAVLLFELHRSTMGTVVRLQDAA